MRNLARAVLTAGCTLLLVLGLSGANVALATPPSGHAASCDYFGRVVDVKGVPLYQFVFCQYIWQREANGSMLNPEAEGWFNTVGYGIQTALEGEVCNFHVDFDAWDSDGNKYFHNQGQKVGGCITPFVGKTGTRDLNADRLIRPNSEFCATLFEKQRDTIKQIARTCAHLS